MNLIRVVDRAIGPADTAADSDRTTAYPRAVEFGERVNQYLLAGDSYVATTPLRRRGVDSPGDSCDADRTAIQHNLPATLTNSTRLNHTFHVQDGVGHCSASFRLQAHGSAVGLDPSQLLDTRGQSAAFDTKCHQAVALDIDKHRIA